jgi:transcriptional regulator with XRE-family HTH domain
MGYGREFRNAIGERLSAMRLEKGLKQKELAKLLGVSTGFVSKMELGLKAVPDDKMDVLMEILGTTVGTLLGAENIKLSPHEGAFRETLEIIRGSGQEETRLGMEMLNVFVKASQSERLILMESLRDLLLARDLHSMSEVNLISRIKSYINRQSTNDTVADDEMYA